MSTGTIRARAQVRPTAHRVHEKVGQIVAYPTRPYADNEAKSCLSTINQPNLATSGEIAIGTVSHHQQRSRYFHNRAHVNLASGKTGPAAIALRHSASHSVTAAAVHWRFRAHTKRRLTDALRCIADEQDFPPGHLQTFAQVYAVTPDLLDSIDRRSALLALARLRRRVRHLVDDLNRAIDSNPDPPSLRRVLTRIQAQPEPPTPAMTTLGQLRSITGQPLDSQYADHPLDCPDCQRINRDQAAANSIIYSQSRPPCVAAQFT